MGSRSKATLRFPFTISRRANLFFEARWARWEGDHGHLSAEMVTQLIELQAYKSPIPPQREGEGEDPIAGNWRERVLKSLTSRLRCGPARQAILSLCPGRGGKTFIKANIKRAGREKNGEQDYPPLLFQTRPNHVRA